jgi:hypothetical protein
MNINFLNRLVKIKGFTHSWDKSFHRLHNVHLHDGLYGLDEKLSLLFF